MIYGVRCGVELLIRHEVKPSALSHNETHTPSAHKSRKVLLAHFKWYRVLCTGRLFALSVTFSIM